MIVDCLDSCLCAVIGQVLIYLSRFHRPCNLSRAPYRALSEPFSPAVGWSPKMRHCARLAPAARDCPAAASVGRPCCDGGSPVVSTTARPVILSIHYASAVLYFASRLADPVYANGALGITAARALVAFHKSSGGCRQFGACARQSASCPARLHDRSSHR